MIHDRRRVRGAKPTVLDGIKFPSRREARRYAVLRQMQAAGMIADLELQVSIELQGRDGPILTPTGRVMQYRADFRYLDMETREFVYEDAKGHPTDVYVLKKAILAAMGIVIREV